MTRSLRNAAIAAVLLTTSVGCSSGNGIFGSDLPAGDISIANGLDGTPLNKTSATNPFVVLGPRFAITIAETRFNGPYSISIVKQQNLPTPADNNLPYPFTFNQPCYVAHQIDTTSHANLVSFLADNANGKPFDFADNPNLTAAELAAGGNLCHDGELEVAQIGDGKGHSVLFYYEEE